MVFPLGSACSISVSKSDATLVDVRLQLSYGEFITALLGFVSEGHSKQLIRSAVTGAASTIEGEHRSSVSVGNSASVYIVSVYHASACSVPVSKSGTDRSPHEERS